MGPIPVDNPGSVVRFFSQDREEDFAEYLEGSSSDHPITEAYLDTYLRTAKSSTELVASTKMKDYDRLLIDINIYQYALKSYIFKIRNNYLKF